MIHNLLFLLSSSQFNNNFTNQKKIHNPNKLCTDYAQPECSPQNEQLWTVDMIMGAKAQWCMHELKVNPCELDLRAMEEDLLHMDGQMFALFTCRNTSHQDAQS